MKRPRSYLFGALAVGTVLILVGIALWFVGPRTIAMSFITATWPRSFSVEQWRAHPNQRYHMAFDLARQGYVRGKSAGEVRAMLGKPASSDTYFMAWPVAYPTGPDEDFVVFLIEGRVVGWSVTSDLLMAPQYD